MIRRRVAVRGHVQGVFFRDSVRREADRHGVAGWVRNCADGSVEAEFEGDAGGVEALVRYVHSGPRGADVESVEVTEEEPRGERGFRVE